MKTKLILLIVIFSTHSQLICSDKSSGYPPIKINFNPTFVVTSESLSRGEVATTTQKKSFKPLSFQLISDLLDKGKSNSSSILSSLSSFGKIKLILCSIGAGYIVLWYKTRSAASAIKNQNSWSQWKNELSFEKLLAMRQDDLGHEIAMAAQRKYLNFKNPTDHITPMVKFCKDVDNEIKKIGRYMTMSKWLKRFYIHKILPVNFNNTQEAQDKINRLTYLKNTFISWNAERNTNKIDPSTISTAPAA